MVTRKEGKKGSETREWTEMKGATGGERTGNEGARRSEGKQASKKLQGGRQAREVTEGRNKIQKRWGQKGKKGQGAERPNKFAYNIVQCNAKPTSYNDCVFFFIFLTFLRFLHFLHFFPGTVRLGPVKIFSELSQTLRRALAHRAAGRP